MSSSGKNGKRVYVRHPRPPIGSKLKPYQLARVKNLVSSFAIGASDSVSSDKFFRECEAAVAGIYPADGWSRRDLVNEAVRRVYSGRLPKKHFVFPKTREQLVAVVARIAKTISDSEKRKRRRRGKPVGDYEAATATYGTADPAIEFRDLFERVFETMRRLVNEQIRDLNCSTPTELTAREIVWEIDVK